MNRTYLSRALIATIAVILTHSNTFGAGDGTGNWEGAITFSPSSKAELEVNLSRSSETYVSGTIAVAGQKGVPQNLENIKVNGSEVSFDLNDGRTVASFNGLLAEDGSTIKGKFSQAGQYFPFELTRGKGNLSTRPTGLTNQE